MTTTTVSAFFAVLSLVCWAATIGVVVITVLARRSDSTVRGIIDELAQNALWHAWLVAAVATAGSLYYSEVAHLIPCELCWYQRICMYPMAVVLLIAAVRRDTDIWRYTLPIVGIGIVIATYHTQLQAYPEQSTFCSATIPCNVRFVWEFGFVSLPLMALSAFVLIFSLVALSRTALSPGKHTPSMSTTHEQ